MKLGLVQTDVMLFFKISYDYFIYIYGDKVTTIISRKMELMLFKKKIIYIYIYVEKITTIYIPRKNYKNVYLL